MQVESERVQVAGCARMCRLQCAPEVRAANGSTLMAPVCTLNCVSYTVHPVVALHFPGALTHV